MDTFDECKCIPNSGLGISIQKFMMQRLESKCYTTRVRKKQERNKQFRFFSSFPKVSDLLHFFDYVFRNDALNPRNIIFFTTLSTSPSMSKT